MNKLLNRLMAIKVIVLSVTVLVFYSFRMFYYRLFRMMKREQIVSAQLYLSRRLLKIIKAKTKTNAIAFERDPNRCYVFMSNHTSFYDTPLIFSAIHEPIRSIGRKSLTRIPVVGWGFAQFHMMPIDKKNIHNATKNFDAIAKTMSQGGVFYACPEGTRSRTGNLLPFEISVFRLARKARAIIIPVGLKGSGALLPSHTLQFGINKTVEINIGEPIDATKYHAVNQIELVKHVFEQIKQLSGSPVDTANFSYVKTNQLF